MPILNTTGKNHAASEICHLHPVWTFLQAAEITGTLTAGTFSCICKYCFCRRHYYHGKAWHAVAHLGGDIFTGSSGWINTFHTTLFIEQEC